MRSIKFQCLFVLLLGLVIALFGVKTTEAYVIRAKWSTSSVKWGFSSYPNSGAWADRATEAANRWTNVSTSSWTWVFDFNWRTGLYRQAIDGKDGAAAVTDRNPLCGVYVCTAAIIVDQDESWYTGTGTPGSTELDLGSVVTHEFGHAATLGHSNDSGISCSGTSRPTMCSHVPYGTNYMRSLEQDDRDGISAAYP